MQKPVYYRYPAIFYYDDDGITIDFPDLPGCLPCAKTTDEAVKNAEECLALHLYGMERDNEDIPDPTEIRKIKPEEGGILVLVEAFMPALRERERTRYVKKTLSIPSWVDAEAQRAHINYSQTLQNAIINQLNLRV